MSDKKDSGYVRNRPHHFTPKVYLEYWVVKNSRSKQANPEQVVRFKVKKGLSQ